MPRESEPKAPAKRSDGFLNGVQLAESVERVKGYDPIRSRRRKLAAALQDQLNLLIAAETGETYRKTVNRRRRDLETDATYDVQQERRVVPWWWIDDDGSVRFALRHGSAQLAVAEGKSVLVLRSVDQLRELLPEIRKEVLAGGLDQALAAASSDIYGRFARKAGPG